MSKNKQVATCVGCGCTYTNACKGGCTWIKIDTVEKVGVCSKCVSQKNLDKYYEATGERPNRREFLSAEKRKEGRCE